MCKLVTLLLAIFIKFNGELYLIAIIIIITPLSFQLPLNSVTRSKLYLSSLNIICVFNIDEISISKYIHIHPSHLGTHPTSPSCFSRPIYVHSRASSLVMYIVIQSFQPGAVQRPPHADDCTT